MHFKGPPFDKSGMIMEYLLSVAAAHQLAHLKIVPFLLTYWKGSQYCPECFFFNNTTVRFKIFFAGVCPRTFDLNII